MLCCITAWLGSARRLSSRSFSATQPRHHIGVKLLVMMAADDEKRVAADVSSAQDSAEESPDTVLHSGNIIGKLQMVFYSPKQTR